MDFQGNVLIYEPSGITQLTQKIIRVRFYGTTARLLEQERLAEEKARQIADAARQVEEQLKKDADAAKQLAQELAKAAEEAKKLKAIEDAIANKTRMEGESDKDFAKRIGVDEKQVAGGASYASSKAWSGGTYKSSGPALTPQEQSYFKGITGGGATTDPIGRTGAGTGAWNDIFNARQGSGAGSGVTITNNFNQSMSRSDVVNITEEQTRSAERA